MDNRAPLRVSIGILAWNESQGIGSTIESLAVQSLVTSNCNRAMEVEVICVPNGCDDDTAEVARRAMAQFLPENGGPAWRVEEVAAAGKSNAWNRYVHEFARPDADYLVLMDADITFIEEDTLLNLVQMLEATPSATVSIDLPVKDIEKKPRRSLVEWLSLRASRLNEGVAPRICGQLYCARAAQLRRLAMPVDLTTQDSFLTAMLRTDMLTGETDEDRIVRAPDASHWFEAYTNLGAIFRHQRAIAIGSTINALLVDYLRENLDGEDAGALIRQRTEEDPAWFSNLIQKHFQERGWWVIPCRVNLHRARMLRGGGMAKIIAGIPVVLAGFLVDSVVALSANHEISRNESSYFWEKSRAE